jgi:hypothetical protein
VSPKPKRELAREHLETAREDLGRQHEKDAVNALFYAAEAAVVAFADGMASKQESSTTSRLTRRRSFIHAAC